MEIFPKTQRGEMKGRLTGQKSWGASHYMTDWRKGHRVKTVVGARDPEHVWGCYE